MTGSCCDSKYLERDRRLKSKLDLEECGYLCQVEEDAQGIACVTGEDEASQPVCGRVPFLPLSFNTLFSSFVSRGWS